MNNLRIWLNRQHFLKKEKVITIYHITIAILAVISIVLVLLDLTNNINILVFPFNWLNNIILLIFTVDYFGRFIRAKKRWQFVYQNIFDLLAILPFSTIFSFFRLARLTQIVRVSLIFRVIGLSGKLTRNLHRFFYGTGLVYMLYISAILLVVSSAIFSQVEHVTFGNSLWWAIVTVTTVGYGDITPTTPIGRALAVILMFLGIGLIGTLTSAITNIMGRTFGHEEDFAAESNLTMQEIEELHKEIRQLTASVNELKSLQLQQMKHRKK
ncbi:potassium channel family protein [Periweissella beninensis]|uniref:Potassium channel family protein n=1 Tax=Periweissella beninensis TaxID=504936 RepID=A0ABT0VG71_9LACO|nr:potassium channel family protein [Periweissella beninensis]MBM7543789.1 voltage-gated potassium channel [Periweissella beninensis]MCM2436829.1 potassium channel family protein [Periweissella beninensis]MCT4395466.1 hypothetical protein [Periweissella beninensis]